MRAPAPRKRPSGGSALRAHQLRQARERLARARARCPRASVMRSGSTRPRAHVGEGAGLGGVHAATGYRALASGRKPRPRYASSGRAEGDPAMKFENEFVVRRPLAACASVLESDATITSLFPDTEIVSNAGGVRRDTHACQRARRRDDRALQVQEPPRRRNALREDLRRPDLALARGQHLARGGEPRDHARADRHSTAARARSCPSSRSRRR